MSKKAIKKAEPKKPSPRAKRSKATEAAAAPSLDQIRDRAYQIFRTGVNPSNPAADWFQAESELKGDARA
jgi:hypothetical protein